MFDTEIVKSFLGLNPPQSGEVVGQYYRRTGQCNQCGSCCTDIYLVHSGNVIADKKTFQALQLLNPDYRWFKPIDEDEHGLLFQCKHLKKDKSCAIYNKRPLFCRKYPSEEGMRMGGKLAQGCGYRFQVKIPFEEVLAKTQTQKTLKPGVLLP